MKKRVLSLLLVGLLLIALLPAAVLAEGDTQPPQTIYTSEECQATAPDAEKSTEKLFDGFVQRQLDKRAPKETAKISGAGEGLTGQMAIAYQFIVSGIHQVAIGQRASTKFEVKFSDVGSGEPARIMAADLGLDSIEDVADAMRSFFLMLYNALKADCPYDFYWHDVTKGFYYNYNYTLGDNNEWIEITYLRFSPIVDPFYQDGGELKVNTTIGQAVVTAGNNVRAILNKYASKSDYEKLRGYNREICDLAEYDYDSLDAYNDGTLVYAGAWQLVWAFDGDPSTNVVCEGYSKAFQHLCDLTNFVGDIHSIIVTGDAGGGHMWNVVRMEDGFNYLMDVTWSDGSSGNEMFFLVGADGAYPTYSFYGSQRTYDEETQRLYGEEKLTLCDRNYTPASIAIRTQPQDVTAVEGTKATFTVEASGTGISYQWYGRASAAESWTLMDGATTATLTLIASEDNEGWQYRCRLTNADSELYTRAATLHVKFHDPDEPVRENEIPATCATDGSYDEVVYCTDCGMELSRTHKTVAKLGHNPGQPVKENEVAATCTTDGGYDEVTYCTRCNGELSRVHTTVPKLGHNPGQPVKENEVAATCTTDGGYDEVTYCTRCNAELSRTHKTIAKLGHNPGQQVKENEVAATCTTDGSYDEVVYCADCGTELSRVHRVEAKHHIPGEPVKENEVPATTETEGGYDEVTYCTRCGAELSRVHKTTGKLPPAHVTFKTQPKSVTKKSGSKVTFKVKVKEKHVTYQWYGRAPGAQEWTKMPGGTKASFKLVVSKAYDGWQFRCGVTNDGEAFSNTVTVTVKPQPPKFSSQPKDIKAKIDAKVKFRAKASGKNVLYQWYYRTSEASGWALIEGATKDKYEFIATADRFGWQFRCRAWNADGEIYSKVVTLRQK